MKRDVLLIIAAVVVVALPLLVMRGRSGPPVVPVPSPNAYDTYVQVGQVVQGVPSDLMQASGEELRQFCAANVDQLAALDAIEVVECVVPFDNCNLQTMLDEMSLIRNAVRLLHAKARLTELEGSPMSAAERYLGIIKMGNRIQHGGLMVHAQLAKAFYRIGLQGMDGLPRELDADERRQIADRLEALTIDDESRADIIARDYSMGVRGMHWATRLFNGRMLRGMSEQSRVVLEENHAESMAALQTTLQSLRGIPPASDAP